MRTPPPVTRATSPARSGIGGPDAAALIATTVACALLVPACGRLDGLGEPVDLLGQAEVAHRQAAGVVAPRLDAHLAVIREVEVGMVVGAARQGGHGVHEGDGGVEVLQLPLAHRALAADAPARDVLRAGLPFLRRQERGARLLLRCRALAVGRPPLGRRLLGPPCLPSDHASGGGAGSEAFAVAATGPGKATAKRSEEHTSELQSQSNLVCRLLLEKKKKKKKN